MLIRVNSSCWIRTCIAVAISRSDSKLNMCWQSTFAPWTLIQLELFCQYTRYPIFVGSTDLPAVCFWPLIHSQQRKWYWKHKILPAPTSIRICRLLEDDSIRSWAMVLFDKHYTGNMRLRSAGWKSYIRVAPLDFWRLNMLACGLSASQVTGCWAMATACLLVLLGRVTGHLMMSNYHASQCPATPFPVIDLNAMDAQRLGAATPNQCREDLSNNWNRFSR